MVDKMKVCAGIMAYNEEKNIGQLLNKLTTEKCLDEVLVVASGCTDRTVEIAMRYPIKLLVQKKREGKASAINLMLKNTRADVIVLESADTLPGDGSIARLLWILEKHPDVGIVGGRPVPINSKDGYVGYAVHLLWDLHDLISRKHPKMGEAIAFRRVFHRIDPKSLVDEASIEILLKAQGYTAYYNPQAIFINKGAETVKDHIKQRKRIYIGHLRLRSGFGFRVSTLSSTSILKLLITHGYFKRHPRKTTFALLLEAYSRLLAWFEFTFRHPAEGVWEAIESSKDLVSLGVENLDSNEPLKQDKRR